ncbi:hypothetical protein ACXYRO_02705 [Mycoplasma sp. 4013]
MMKNNSMKIKINVPYLELKIFKKYRKLIDMDELSAIFVGIIKYLENPDFRSNYEIKSTDLFKDVITKVLNIWQRSFVLIEEKIDNLFINNVLYTHTNKYNKGDWKNLRFHSIKINKKILEYFDNDEYKTLEEQEKIVKNIIYVNLINKERRIAVKKTDINWKPNFSDSNDLNNIIKLRENIKTNDDNVSQWKEYKSGGYDDNKDYVFISHQLEKVNVLIEENCEFEVDNNKIKWNKTNFIYSYNQYIPSFSYILRQKLQEKFNEVFDGSDFQGNFYQKDKEDLKYSLEENQNLIDKCNEQKSWIWPISIKIIYAENKHWQVFKAPIKLQYYLNNNLGNPKTDFVNTYQLYKEEIDLKHWIKSEFSKENTQDINHQIKDAKVLEYVMEIIDYNFTVNYFYNFFVKNKEQILNHKITDINKLMYLYTEKLIEYDELIKYLKKQKNNIYKNIDNGEFIKLVSSKYKYDITNSTLLNIFYETFPWFYDNGEVYFDNWIPEINIKKAFEILNLLLLKYKSMTKSELESQLNKLTAINYSPLKSPYISNNINKIKIYLKDAPTMSEETFLGRTAKLRQSLETLVNSTKNVSKLLKEKGYPNFSKTYEWTSEQIHNKEKENFSFNLTKEKQLLRFESEFDNSKKGEK